MSRHTYNLGWRLPSFFHKAYQFGCLIAQGIETSIVLVCSPYYFHIPLLRKQHMEKRRRKSRNRGLQDRFLHRLFDIGIAIKGIDGALEVIGGFLFYFVSQEFISKTVLVLTQHELIEDPGDLIANFIQHATDHISVSGKLFGSIYLLAHGFCKVFLVVCLLRNKLWAYPVALMFLISFIGFQLYWISLHFSWSFTFLTGMDMIVVMLIWHEYRNHNPRQMY